MRRPTHRRAWIAVAATMLMLPAPYAFAAEDAPLHTKAAATSAPTADKADEAAKVKPVKTRILISEASLEKARERGRAAAKGHARPEPKTPFQDEKRSPAKKSADAADLTLVEAAEIIKSEAPKQPLPLQSSVERAGLTGSGDVKLSSSSAESAEAATVTAAAIGETPPQAQVDGCMSAGADAPNGRIQNRFTHCQRFPIIAEYWTKDASGRPVEHQGTTKATIEVFAQGFDTQRTTRVFAQIQKGSVSYDWGLLDNIFTAPSVPFSLFGVCADGQISCTASRSPATLLWDTWNNNPTWGYWDIGNPAVAGVGRDKLMYSLWHVNGFTETDEYDTDKPASTPNQLIRCDSATYIWGDFGVNKPAACIFPTATAFLTYFTQSDHGKVAEHIYYAQWYPNSTFPRLAPAGQTPPRDKRIPGTYEDASVGGPGLHRITPTLHPTEYQANRDHKDGACYGKGPQASTYAGLGLDPQPDTSTEQCDEYPFASTLEGAGNPYWDFSVKAVPQRDNSVAGGLLIAYYNGDRMLAWDANLPEPNVTNDKFFVRIQP